ncbi:unnamed protein product, partial (mitochondrion) [Musa textilis]
ESYTIKARPTGEERNDCSTNGRGKLHYKSSTNGRGKHFAQARPTGEERNDCSTVLENYTLLV